MEFLEWLAVRHELPRALTVLDVGCGPGRLLPLLAARGWQVVGLEPDLAYRARATEVADQIGASVQPGGFNDIDAHHEYDLVIGINGSFAHALTANARADALARCAEALRPGGLLVLDLPNTLRILFEYRPRESREATVDGRLVHYARRHTVDYHAVTFTTHETYIVTERDGDCWTFEKDHVYALTAWPDLEYLLRQAGFTAIKLFPAVTARDPGPLTGARLVVLAR
ncbi:MAG: class I SAM-dependent methyltransferase [Gemmatimonadaceae bacterium]